MFLQTLKKSLILSTIYTNISPSLSKNITQYRKKFTTVTVSNYCPISLLSVFSKIFEKAMCHRIYSLLSKGGFPLLISLQYLREKNSHIYPLEENRQNIF